MKIMMIGEIRIGGGCIHQQMLADALNAELTTAFPKNEDHEKPTVVLGKLLKDKPTANLQRAQRLQFEIVAVEAVVTPEVAARIVALLKGKPKLETYEKKALEHLAGTVPTERKKSSEKKSRKSKAVANG